MRQLLVCFALWVLVPTAMKAEEKVIVLDPQETELTFHLGATGHDVEGTLFLRSGELHIDTENGEANGELVVDATRTVSGSKSRDKTMHKKVLESQDHPLMVFRAQKIQGTVPQDGEGSFQLEGEMVLIGKSHPMTLPIQAQVREGKLSGTSEFTIPFVEWGLHDPSIAFLRVKKVVTVSVRAEGTVTAAAEAAAGE